MAESSSFLVPERLTYDYLSGGRRKLLIHCNDLHVADFDQEISVLRAALAELRGTDSTSSASTA
ncbi:hypothetical protein ACIRL2_47120 [Embleya sp. NPDC127516]|uniref:hypothetical protein n=1 Tax=Embleya sp. NPDC127516 TaxID=3363990 RepID=UPI0038240D8C